MSILTWNVADEDNELLIGWTSGGNMQVLVEGSGTVLSLVDGFQMSELVNGWHKHCFTFKNSGSIKVFDFVVAKASF